MEKSTFTGGNYVNGTWFCDRCSKSSTGERWFCQQCSADICYDCVPASESKKSKSIYTLPAARAALGLALISQYHSTYTALVNAVEAMLAEQICSAIGKTIQPSDFAEYMDFHNEMLFREGMKPRGFCHAIRRPNAYPEGTISIEVAGSTALPVKCISAHRVSDGSPSSVFPPIKFPLSAAADLTFYGDQYLHSFVQHKFARGGAGKLQLAARARQFSSFVLLIGKLSGPGSFDPESAIIIKNKDELIIPLLLETIPTPKEFRDAIESLSPEQQAFCKSFRAMQLSSTLFAVAVIQIKPQLERVLNLPSNLLTKEVKLTQDLMQLFVEYQISPDLLAFDPDVNHDSNGGESKSATARERAISSVKANVGQIKEFISDEKKLEIKQHMQEQAKSLDMERALGEMPSGGMRPRGRMNEVNMERALGAMPSREMRSRGRMKSMTKGFSFGGAPPAFGAASFGAPPPAPTASAGMANMKAMREPRIEGGGGRPAPTPNLSKNNGTTYTKNPSSSSSPGDWTTIPKRMDATFEKFNSESLRPTIIKAGKRWVLTRQNGLLSKPQQESFTNDKQKKAKNEAFDLLDALTRSGAMPILTGASFHVVMATTHCFDKSLMNTLVQDNINPIDKVERSQLIVASLIHGLPVRSLVEDSAIERLKGTSPKLLAE